MNRRWGRRKDNNQSYVKQDNHIPIKGEYDIVDPPTKNKYGRTKGARSKEPEWMGMFGAPTPINVPHTSGWIKRGQEEEIVEELVYYGYDERDVRKFNTFIYYDNSWGDRSAKFPTDIYGVREIRGWDENFKFRRTKGK